MTALLPGIYEFGVIVTAPVALGLLLTWFINDSNGHFDMLFLGVIIAFMATPLIAVGWPICWIAVMIYAAQNLPKWKRNYGNRLEQKRAQKRKRIEDAKPDILRPCSPADTQLVDCLKPEDRAWLESHGWIGSRSTGTLTVSEAVARFGYINPATIPMIVPDITLEIPKGYPGWGEYRITGDTTPDANELKKRSCHVHDNLCLNCPSDFHRTGCTTPGCWDRAVKERSQRLDWSY